ncbi:MAG: DUF1538 domain-containing protein [Syntrophomonas sp.]|nr:DUF1538 domain-containing protein [Syntrophomonas sp.]
MSVITDKIKEVLYSVLPITAIVLILNFTLTPVETPLIIRFLLGAVLIVLGLTVFLIGVDIGITPIGNTMGATIAKTNRIWIVALAGLILGFIISIAEPDLHILAGQVDAVTSGVISKSSIVIIVSAGIAVMLSLGLLRIVLNFPLYKMLMILYGVILVLALFISPEFLAISFDASGATTGALTVPFMLALAMGVSMLKKDSRSSEEDSFGLVAIASAGAIISVMAMGIISNTKEVTGSLDYQEVTSVSLLEPFIQKLPIITGEVALALLPILAVFLLFQKTSFKLSIRTVRKILFGMLFTLLGLIIFLLGVNAGFMEVGSVIGYKLASYNNNLYVIVIGFILGIVTILAEPAVHVLTHQIENVTSGYVKRNVVLTTLSIGVGLAVALSIIRITIPSLQLWHYLLPGYLISLAFTFFVPKLFVGIAFDSGGVASGPMTATFILAYAQGAAEAIEGANVLIDGFGVIAMVAMTPLIALQVLGFIFKMKSKKGGIVNDAEQA